ncbi:hypothetical protein Sa45lw_74 [Escherichia phage vB_EcoM-Sa45lw]|uniref:Uncharacterized protein n=1 Tax=Escherichia phage vB_EcoM-Sa45lw TaxID=2589644 RepID=A0A4Y6E924_9CAUD|nr:hypothetical protein Sa45lw_74 [Escherichia phage vB_EcoM-Sa45lw]
MSNTNSITINEIILSLFNFFINHNHIKSSKVIHMLIIPRFELVVNNFVKNISGNDKKGTIA